MCPRTLGRVYHARIRSQFGPLLAGSIGALCLLVGVAALASEGVAALLTVWPWLGTVALLAWALYWHPEVAVGDRGVRLVNPTRTIDVPWPALESVDTKWALTLVTVWGKHRAWAAPAPGRSVLRQQLRKSVSQDRRIPGLPANASARPADLPHTDSGAAAQLVNEHWKRMRDAGELDAAAVPDHLPARWHWDVLGAVVALVALGMLGFLI